MHDEDLPDRLTDRVRRELREEAAIPDRLASVVTERVPSPVPGLVLLCFARSGGADAGSAEDALDAAVAVEFAALHQYIHEIPTADALEAPARDSPYADDEVAAIIDSDWLQAAAFVRVSAGAPTPSTARRCYAALAEGSTGCYELRRQPADACDAPPLAPLIAAAGRVGAIVAGLDGEAAATAADVAGTIGESVRVRTPAGAVGGEQATVPERASLLEDLAGVVPEPGSVVDALRSLAGEEPAVGATDRAGGDR